MGNRDRRADRALGGGIPRGRITEVVGAMGVGKTALLRQVVARVLQTGGWVAWIDARRTLAAAPWAGMGDRLVVIRPHDNKRSAWCADLLLRSGVFALVVLDGAPALSRVHGVRLAQLARERDAACVVLQQDTRPSRVSGAVRLRLDQRMHRSIASRPVGLWWSWRGGPSSSSRNVRSIEVNSDIVMAHRVCTGFHDSRSAAWHAARVVLRPPSAAVSTTPSPSPSPGRTRRLRR
jgi:hypothetical protein